MTSKNNKTDPGWSRRRFLRTGLAVAGVGVGGFLAYSDKPVRERVVEAKILPDYSVEASSLYPDFAVARGLNPETLVRGVVDKLGGISRFIAKGDRVLIKPNVGWDRQPEQAANTNPEVVAAVVTLCREAGAALVWVTDVPMGDSYRAFDRSGIEGAVLRAGGEVRHPASDDFVATEMGGEILGVWPVSRFFHEVDKVINIPIVKNHSLSGCTLGMKNLYGVLGGRRNQLHQAIHTSIVDLAAAVRPTLTIMDAIRVLKENGPTGGRLSDVRVENTVAGGVDMVALDSYALGFLDLTPDRVPFLKMGEERGLGVVDWRSLNRAEIQLG